MNNFWIKWRRDIVRGGVLFLGVVIVGSWVVRNVRAGRDRLVNEFSDRLGSLNFDFNDESRPHGPAFEWHGPVSRAQTVWVRNMNGPIEISRGSSDQVEVSAEKSWHHSSPESVRIVTVPDPSGGGVTICALWGDRSSCSPRGSYSLRNPRNSDVAVRFSIRVPKGVAVDAQTINGPLQATDVTGDLNLATVSGHIKADGAVGRITAKAVNGGIEIALGAVGTGGVSLETVNGSVTLRLPPKLNADLDASSVVGRVSAALPIQVAGRVDPRHLTGRIGEGGPTLHIRTVNGEITLEQGVPNAPVPPPAPAAHRAPKRASQPAPDQPR